MEYYQPFKKLDAYDGTFLLSIPLGIIFLCMIIGEMLVSVKINPPNWWSRLRFSYGISIINIFMYTMLQGLKYKFKYNVKNMDVIFKWFLLAFYVLDRLFLLRNVYWTSYIGNENTRSLTTSIRHKQIIELILGILELCVFFTFKTNSGSLLLLYTLFYFTGIRYFNMDLYARFKRLKDIEISDLEINENYKRRTWFFDVFTTVFIALIQFISTFGFRVKIISQFIKLMCIMFLAFRCLFRSLILVVLSFMVDMMDPLTEEKEVILFESLIQEY